ncbi:MAG: S8 family serine peptidase [Cyclobacteriaceae bacterium]|nr:S8 family serine peptidase [Cyclobacteriaceae bacterium]
MVKGSVSVIILLLLHQLVAAHQSAKFHADIIVIKLNPPSASNGRIASGTSASLDQISQIVDAEGITQVFPPGSITNARLADTGLQYIYKLKLRPGANVWRELAKLNKLAFVRYAEPYLQNHLLFVPNDPQARPGGGLQDYLTVIRAYDGWQIDQSDSSMIIGIVDTGVNMKHEDLANVAYNHADPINGKDDDGDGYIDNFRGWDLADADNDPTADGHPHGTPVAGVSSATTNNGVGMAGVGFKSKYLPVKIAETASQLLTHDYEGIIYAANHGCKVINLSWGAAGEYWQYGQDIINYAVLEKDVVVVAAAGNTPGELDFYPASFDHVLSVGATDIDDRLASWATYSHKIDLMAPGNNVYTTKNNGGYEKTTGSSFASPMVAGAAALVRAHFPELSAIQVMEQLRITSDDIYAIGNNMEYKGKLGHGRLNVYRALSDIITPSIRISAVEYQGNHDQLVFAGDTLRVVLTFTNYLRKAENVSVTIGNASNNATVDNEQIYIESLGAFQQYKNVEQPLAIVVGSHVAPGEKLLFRVDFLGNSYTDFQYISIETTPPYFEISGGELTATIASDGDIGFDDNHFEKGKGLSFNHQLLAVHSGLIIGRDAKHLMNNVVNDLGLLTRDNDFVSENDLKLYNNARADFDARSVFRPAASLPSALNLKIEQKVLAWHEVGQEGSLIFEYRIINTGDSAISKLNAALFADWDLGDFTSNRMAWDSLGHFGYAFDNTSHGMYAGMALLTDQQTTSYAIDKASLHGNTADIDSLFTDQLKFQFLKSSVPKNQAGTQGTGNDIAQLLGAREIYIEPKQSAKVAIVMLAAGSLDGLRTALQRAKTRYADYAAHPPLAETFYACLGENAIIDPAGVHYDFLQTHRVPRCFIAEQVTSPRRCTKIRYSMPSIKTVPMPVR